MGQQFTAYDFIFDNISSVNFGLKLINLDNTGLFSGVGSANTEIYTQKVLRADKVYYLGRSINAPLEFHLTFGSQQPISGLDRNIISNWLFGRSGYKKLQIVQDDLDGMWFNCFLTSPTTTYVGNLQYAFDCTVSCDSQFAYGPTKTVTRTFTGDNVIDYDLTLYNESSNDDYLYPNISFELNTVGNSFSITNLDDNDREFLFSDLQASETISVDNAKQIIVSDTGLHRLSNFNKKWLRLVPKTNRLHIESGIGTFTIIYNNRIKIGG